MKMKHLLTLLPIFALVGCQTTGTGQKVPTPRDPLYEVSFDEELPVLSVRNSESDFVTYLMLSTYGYITVDGFPAKGAVSDLFYENTIVLKADPGTPLPDASSVKSTNSGTTFRGWAYYDEENDHVWPDYYTEVPSTQGLALKAIFDGTDAGGGSGGGSGGGGSGGGGGTTQSGFGIIKGDGTAYIGESKGTNFEGYDEYLVKKVTFAAGEKFSLYDPSTLGTWAVNINPYSFAPDPSAPTSDPERVASYVMQGTTDYTVLKDFTGDFYIQIMYQQDRLYIELA